MSENIEINQQDFEKIEQFISGSLSSEDLINFKKRLKNDPLLQQQVKEYEVLISGVEKQSLRNKLNDFHKEFESEKKNIIQPKKSLSITKFSIAATVALIIGFTGFWLYNSKNTNQKLYAEHFGPDPGLPTVMSNNNDFDFYDAMVDYKRGNYNVAIKKWENILTKSPENDTLNYFLGVSYLAEKNQFKAIEFLTRVLNESNSIFLNDANFYLGLAYLKNNDIEKSIQSFKKSDNEKSQNILDNLNNTK